MTRQAAGRPASATYDVFISYSHKNKKFVHDWLVPALKRRRLRVLLDEEIFAGGQYAIAEMEKAVRASRAVVLVCTPEYFDSKWTELESKLAFGKVVAVILKTCTLPDWLQSRIHLDVKTPAMREKSLPRLIKALRATDAGGNGERGSIFDDPAAKLLCRYVVDRYRYLDFRGMGVTDRVALKLSLGELYVPLRVRVQLPEGGTSDSRTLRVAGRELSKEEARATGLHAREAQSVLDLVREQKGVIILGDPGSGKTTFLKFLALGLARREHRALGLPPLLPVVVPLSALARNTEISVADFAADYYAERCENAAVGTIVRRALNEGKALVLMDGLDEVREERKRLDVVKRVEEFAALYRDGGNKLALTSRIVGYHLVRPNIDDAVECTLADFDEDEVAAFVEKWTGALERAARGDTALAKAEARTQQDALLRAVRANDGVRRLAANPLLLTILALMQRQGVSLPARRVELYDTYVRTLVRTWNLARGLDQSTATPERDVIDTIRVLAPLALWMHETSPGVGLVKRQAALNQLVTVYERRGAADPEKAANAFLEDVEQHTGLLLARGPAEYGFIHLTFQEYLAAVAIAQEGQRGLDKVIERLSGRVGDPMWREVSLLALGYLGIVQQREEAAAEVVEALVARQPGEPGQAVVLAGEAVADASPGGVTPTARARVVEALLATLRDGAKVPSAQRAEAGTALGRLGDPRFHDARGWCLPKEPVLGKDPLLGFVEIPAGPFTMGSDKARDSDAYDDETLQHPVALPAYYLARWPVTVAQFRAFVEGVKVAPGDPDCLTGVANHPVVNVSWHEALAYCRWLTEQLRASDKTPEPLATLLRTGGDGRGPWQVTLPSEGEWEKAARGGDGRIYPWGNEPDPNRANYADTGIGGTSAVGCFPGGASPYGVEDLSGNVWEWTRSLWGKDSQQPEFRYPYRPEDGRENRGASDDVHRVVRGGSLDARRDVRAAYRDRNTPDGRNSYIGFRVVVSPFSSDL